MKVTDVPDHPLIGSGKTTLLSLITGDHPQSYTQIPPKSQLTLFGRSRSRIPTPQLRSLIGVVSPELYNAFPRRSGMSVWDVVGTGFDGGFIPLGTKGVGVGLAGGLTGEETQWRVNRVWEVLRGLGPHTWLKEGVKAGMDMNIGTQKNINPEAFAARSFINLSAGEQSVVLLMRALVGRPQLVLLDEVWSGMDEAMINAARTYLKAGGLIVEQAVVVISHWEDEVPWGVDDGVKKFRLEGGEGTEV
jgi:ABC-type molybdenum transport system ATPase subunit/photorepair protein PhrA